MQGAAGEHCSQRPTKTLQCSCVNVPALYIIYTYIVQPLGAYKTQLGGTYISSLLFYMVNVYCDYTCLCNYKYIISFFVSIYCWCFCTSVAFHIRIRKDCSEHVCVCFKFVCERVVCVCVKVVSVKVLCVKELCVEELCMTRLCERAVYDN